MSNFFSNLFGGKQSSKVKTIEKNTINIDTRQQVDDNLDEDLPVLNRRFSLSKSGRLREKKRKKIAIPDLQRNSNEVNDKTDNDVCDTGDGAVFDEKGIIREMMRGSDRELIHDKK